MERMQRNSLKNVLGVDSLMKEIDHVKLGDVPFYEACIELIANRQPGDDSRRFLSLKNAPLSTFIYTSVRLKRLKRSDVTEEEVIDSQTLSKEMCDFIDFVNCVTKTTR